MATYYVDYVGGNDANNGTSFALRKKTITSGTSVASAGDTVRVMASAAPASLGQSATWTNQSKTVTLSSSVTQLVSACDSNWTASTNVTCVSNTTRKEGTDSQSISVGASFTTGKAAYFATGLLNLSAYNQVSFWLYCVNGVSALTNLTLNLCTDTVGAVALNSISIPTLTGWTTGNWIPITVDTGSALGSAIQSVALYVGTNNGAFQVLLDDIIACGPSGTASSLSLTSLLGLPNSTFAGGTNVETWYPIKSINGTTVILDQGPTAVSTVGQGWSGTTGSYATYRIETTKTAIVSTITTVVQTMSTSGSAGNLITVSGGWNTTDMSTQVGETWYDGGGGVGIGLNYASARNYCALSYISFVRYYTGIACASSTGCTFNNIASNGNVLNGINTGFTSCTFSNIFCNNNTNNSFVINAGNGGNTYTNLVFNNNTIFGYSNVVAAPSSISTFTGIVANNNGSSGLSFSSNSTRFLNTVTTNYNGAGGVAIQCNNTTINTITSNNNTGAGISLANTSNNNRIFNITANTNSTYAVTLTNTCVNNIFGGPMSTTGNTSGVFQIVTGAAGGINYVRNATYAEGTFVASFTSYGNQYLYSQDDDGVTGAFKIYTDGGSIAANTSIVYLTGGTSWQFSPTSVNRSSGYPLQLILGRFLATSGVTYTISCYVYRDSVTTLNAQLLVAGGQLQGVGSDISTLAGGSASAWNLVTLTSFTPTETGVIEVTGLVWDGTGTTNNAYFDYLTINNGSQAFVKTLNYTDWRMGPGPQPLNATGQGFY